MYERAYPKHSPAFSPQELTTVLDQPEQFIREILPKIAYQPQSGEFAANYGKGKYVIKAEYRSLRLQQAMNEYEQAAKAAGDATTDTVDASTSDQIRPRQSRTDTSYARTGRTIHQQSQPNYLSQQDEQPAEFIIEESDNDS